MKSGGKGKDFSDAPAYAPILRDMARCRHPSKEPYRSKREAKVALTRHRRIRRTGLEPYLCACGVWHIGHKPRAVAA